MQGTYHFEINDRISFDDTEEIKTGIVIGIEPGTGWSEPSAKIRWDDGYGDTTVRFSRITPRSETA